LVRVGMTSGWEPGTVVQGWPMVYINKGLVDSIEKAGAIPVIIPVLDEERKIEAYMEFIDGIIISGETMSIKRNVVTELKSNVLESSNPLRYKNEAAAIQAAIKYGKPLLGICRGHQVLTVMEGGSVGDEDINVGNEVLHQQFGVQPPDTGIHRINIVPGSMLSKMVKTDSVMVNSFHRQAVNKVPEGYRVCAFTEDGRIEAIEYAGTTFRMGLQFHPEMLKEEVWESFFEVFVKIVSERS
jgi:putative glutamine amidotransferase